MAGGYEPAACVGVPNDHYVGENTITYPDTMKRYPPDVEMETVTCQT